LLNLTCRGFDLRMTGPEGTLPAASVLSGSQQQMVRLHGGGADGRGSWPQKLWLMPQPCASR
jgi:hypothetical protein